MGVPGDTNGELAMRWLLWGLIALGIYAPLGAWIDYIEDDAEGKARAFCARFPVGAAIADVASAAAGAGEDRLRIIDKKQVSIAYVGVPPFSRHFCSYDSDAGKVTSARYIHGD
jgi:hypothetical protein